MSHAAAPLALVDAHVHLWSCFDIGRLLDAAAHNLRTHAERIAASPDAPALLCLAEAAGEDAFGALAASPEIASPDGPPWRVLFTDEPESLRLERPGARLLVVAGRQVATAERLEVLALATRRRFPDGLPLEATYEAVAGADALAVLPWGFGKWWGARGRRVRRLTANRLPETLLLGDNGGRPERGPAPRLLRALAARGARVLPGSDPLPFPGEERRAGSFGFALRAAIDPEQPAASLRAALACGARPEPFGRGQALRRFATLQLALQWRARMGGAAA